MPPESEVDAVVTVALREFGFDAEVVEDFKDNSFELALKRFEKEFPTMESQKAYVSCFLKRCSSQSLADLKPGFQTREAYRYWFQVICPNLPKIRNHEVYRSYLKSRPFPLYVVGQLVKHRKTGQRGVIISVDRGGGERRLRIEQNTTENSRSRPWYRWLIHRTQNVCYVAERHLEEDSSGKPVEHPLLKKFFNCFQGTHYIRTVH